MLNITFLLKRQSGQSETLKVLTWYTAQGAFEFKKQIQETFNKILKEHLFTSISFTVYADGNELDYIGSRFANIPYSHSSCCWRGEFAQFIVDNF